MAIKNTARGTNVYKLCSVISASGKVGKYIQVIGNRKREFMTLILKILI